MKKRSTRLPLVLLALALPLCLSSSQAGPHEGSVAAASEAGVCEPGAGDASAEVRARLARLAAQEAQVQAAGEVIVLNGQGFNYSAGEGRDLEQIRKQLARELDLAR